MNPLTVWAPNARSVELVKADTTSFTPAVMLDKTTVPYLGKNMDGYWKTPGGANALKDGDGYWFKVVFDDGTTKCCIDPYARTMQYDTSYSIYKDLNNVEWSDAKFQPPAKGNMVIYQIFQGAYMGRGDGSWTDPNGKNYGFTWIKDGKRGDFVQLRNKLDYIQSLGVNTIELLPINEYPQDDIIGYDSVSFFAVESSYAGANADGSYPNSRGRSYDDLKEFINDAHGRNIAVVADVVFNHIGTDTCPGPLKIFISAGNPIYLSGEATQYGMAPDWSNPGVQKYIEDACYYYLEELHFDGLRFDDTAEITNKNTDKGASSGTEVLKRILMDIKKKHPNKILISENWPYSSWETSYLGFDAGWFNFRVAVAGALYPNAPGAGDQLNTGINGGGYLGAHSRVIYANNHDECWWDGDNNHPPSKFWPVRQFGWRGDYWSQKKSRMISALSFFVPGIPMFFMADEFAMENCFNDDHLETIPDWGHETDMLGNQFKAMFRTLIKIRQTYDQLIDPNAEFYWLWTPNDGWFAFKRKAGASVLIVAGNWYGTDMMGYSIPTMGETGNWTQIFNSDGQEYGGEGVGNFMNNPKSDAGSITINIPKNGIVVMNRTAI